MNTIHGIEFQTSELNKYREQARELALKAAKEKAEKMAAVLGQSLGDPVQINETGGCSPGGFGRNRAVQTKTNFVSNVEGSSDSEFAGTLALGKISIRANVGVIFDLKK